MAVVGFVDDGGDVIVDQVAIETGIAEGADTLGEVQGSRRRCAFVLRSNPRT